MRVKLLTFRYSATLGGFDDSALVDFTRDKEVIAFREHFYLVNEVPHLSCVVHYQDAVVPQAALAAAREIPPRAQPHPQRLQRRDGAPDPCEGMSESERALFNHLREWRSKQARDDGVPPYLLLTNRQLVELVRRRPDSPTALGHIDGVGPGKVERYGTAILRCLHGHAPSAPPLEAATAPAEPTTAEVAP
jgi:superfamily II DNA helicase RecQ